MTSARDSARSSASASYQISELAELTGFPASTLRYYEEVGVLAPPERGANGYRTYGDRDIERLRFVARAKELDLTLEEITDLIRLWDGDRCAPVQERLRDLVTDKVGRAQERVAELIAFTQQLQRAAARLADEPGDGPCSDGCTCWRHLDDSPVEAGDTGAVPLVAGELVESGDGPPLVCTLGEGIEERIAEWRALGQQVTAREALPDGMRVRLAATADPVDVARLAAAEFDCCSWATFSLTIGPRGLSLDVTGPEAARPVIEATLGTA